MSRAAARKPRGARPASRTFSIAEARAHLPDVVRRAESGEEIQITRRGVPVAVLRAVSSSDQERIERFRALVDRARAGANDEDEDDPWANLRDESHGRPPPSFE